MRVPAPTQRFSSFDGTAIAYYDSGPRHDARAVVLHHGFASSAFVNWHRPGIVDALVAAGRRVVTFDVRGHGASEHPHDPASYGNGALRKDVTALADFLGLKEADLGGYSLGSFVALEVAISDRRVSSLFLGGVGTGQSRYTGTASRSAVVRALESDDAGEIAASGAAAYRSFADALGQDRFALAALQRGFEGFCPERARQVKVRADVVNGERDELVGDPCSLAQLMDDARCAVVPGDHMSAVTRPEFLAALVEWASRETPKR